MLCCPSIYERSSWLLERLVARPQEGCSNRRRECQTRGGTAGGKIRRSTPKETDPNYPQTMLVHLGNHQHWQTPKEMDPLRKQPMDQQISKRTYKGGHARRIRGRQKREANGERVRGSRNRRGERSEVTGSVLTVTGRGAEKDRAFSVPSNKAVLIWLNQ